MKVGILIGRFQVPEPHAGHQYLIKEILNRCDRLIILIGSANRARSIKNPYLYRERREAMLTMFREPYLQGKLDVRGLNDYMYSNSQWISDVVTTIEMLTNPSVDTIVLFGHMKEGNDYLKWFPQYDFENVLSPVKTSGTFVRESNIDKLPASVRDDFAYYKKEAELFKDYPFKETLNFNCADAVLECSGHVLLIQRKFAPGAGTWALPGGFRHNNETFIDCAIRELQEETNVRVPEKVLYGSIKQTQLFDNPARSNGILRNTLAVHMVVQPEQDGSLPRANGADDAMRTKWVPLSDALNKFPLYDDHKDIISIMTKTNPVIALSNKYL